MDTTNLEMLVWIHSHYKTGKHWEYDILTVSGKDIGLDMLDSLREYNKDDVDKFADLETERAYRVTVKVEYEPLGEGGWYIGELLEAELVDKE